jgi:phenylacetate-CoA ligase
MHGFAQRIYHKSPAPLRTIIASGGGLYLRWWRYSGETDRLVAEALERERWPAHRWQAWREEKLASLLHRAATRVPYYREKWTRRRRSGDRASWEVLENWPILTKEELRAGADAFLADDRDTRRMFTVQTSGTSGTPLTLFRSREVNQAWFALFEARWRRWYGVSRRDWWAMLGGQLPVPINSREPPFWVRNYGLRQLYLSTYHISSATVSSYLDAMERAKVEYMLGYPSAMHHLAGLVLEHDLPAVQLAVAVSNAEALHPYQREAITRAFGCPVRNTYGMGEAVAAASECERQVLHLWPEAGFVEVLEDGSKKAVAPGQVGRLVCTGISNPDMPLVRYELGDRGALSADTGECRCGRTLPRLERLEGRLNDYLLAADGRRVFWLNPVFYDLPVVEGQIIQEQLDRVRIRLVPGTGYSTATEEVLRSRIQERVGRVEVTVDRMGEIPRGANGKFRAVIRQIPEAGTHGRGTAPARQSP